VAAGESPSEFGPHLYIYIYMNAFFLVSFGILIKWLVELVFRQLEKEPMARRVDLRQQIKATKSFRNQRCVGALCLYCRVRVFMQRNWTHCRHARGLKRQLLQLQLSSSTERSGMACAPRKLPTLHSEECTSLEKGDKIVWEESHFSRKKRRPKIFRKKCTSRESNPGLYRGRVLFYH
jgi:hypothetical protein